MDPMKQIPGFAASRIFLHSGNKNPGSLGALPSAPIQIGPATVAG
jgi:hypothetical protein